MDNIESTQLLTRSSVNFERMNLAFLGTPEEKKKLEIEIAASGKPLVIYDGVKDDEGGRLELVPSGVYGLLTGFDVDVLTVIYFELYKITKEVGSCPEEARVSLSEFPKIMKLQTSGNIYERIKESLKRIHTTVLFQENYIKIKESKTDTLKNYDLKPAKLIDLIGLHKETLSKRGTEKMRKLYIDLKIPSWLRSNINNNYTSELDTEIYFSIKGDRARRMYRILEFIRYEKEIFLSYRKLERELYLFNMPTKFKNQTLKRALEILKNINYIANYKINENNVLVVFNETKRAVRAISNRISLTDMESALLDVIVVFLNDEASRAWLAIVIKKVPMELIDRAISLTRETIEMDGIKKSKGAIFTDHLKRICIQHKIDLFSAV